jgi:hypothetical protein
VCKYYAYHWNAEILTAVSDKIIINGFAKKHCWSSHSSGFFVLTRSRGNKHILFSTLLIVIAECLSIFFVVYGASCFKTC